MFVPNYLKGGWNADDEHGDAAASKPSLPSLEKPPRKNKTKTKQLMAGRVAPPVDYIFPLPEWAALVWRTQEDTLFSSLFSKQWTVTLYPSSLLRPSLCRRPPPSPLSFYSYPVAGSVPRNIRGSPVICDPSNPHLISLKRGSIHFAAWRAPNRPRLLWQVSTLANNCSSVPWPQSPV